MVTSGQFLIESEANLKGILEKMQAPGAKIHTGTGRITKVDAKTGELEMQHEPIPSLKWPGMTMEFEVKDPAILKGLKVGEQVDFDLADEDGSYPVVAIRPKPMPAMPGAK